MILMLTKSCFFFTFPVADADMGANISDIINSLQSNGYSEGEVRTAIENLSNEGMIYSTIDEAHFQVGE